MLRSGRTQASRPRRLCRIPNLLLSPVLLYWRELASATMAAELVLYLAGAVSFLRNGGHSRWARGQARWGGRECRAALPGPAPCCLALAHPRFVPCSPPPQVDRLHRPCELRHVLACRCYSCTARRQPQTVPGPDFMQHHQRPACTPAALHAAGWHLAEACVLAHMCAAPLWLSKAVGAASPDPLPPRPQHLLHYYVTVAAGLHVWLILSTLAANGDA